MGTSEGNISIAIILVLVALSVVIFVIGLFLRRRGHLSTRGAAFAWAVLTVLPLFGGGFLLITKHQVERSTEPVQGHDAAPVQ